MSYLIWKGKKWKHTKLQLFKDSIALFVWFWNCETALRSATTLERTYYFNTRQLAFYFNHHAPHGSVVTRDCESRQLQVPATVSSTAESRTTDSGRSRMTTGCREGGMFQFLRQTNNKAKCTSLCGSWQITPTGKKEKQQQQQKAKSRTKKEAGQTIRTPVKVNSISYLFKRSILQNQGTWNINFVVIAWSWHLEIRKRNTLNSL